MEPLFVHQAGTADKEEGQSASCEKAPVELFFLKCVSKDNQENINFHQTGVQNRLKKTVPSQVTSQQTADSTSEFLQAHKLEIVLSANEYHKTDQVLECMSCFYVF